MGFALCCSMFKPKQRQQIAIQEKSLLEAKDEEKVKERWTATQITKFHTNARSTEVYKQRVKVKDNQVPWTVDMKDYSPPDFTHDKVFANDRTTVTAGWADPPGFYLEKAFRDRPSYLPAPEPIDDRPLNPVGRTGLRGRGLLGKWGPNQAADPMVTRFNPDTGVIEFILIQRKSGTWALPGGMVDDGELVSTSLQREFAEEAAKLEKKEDRDNMDAIFSAGPHQEMIYAGYSDDIRNTDNAWIETTTVLFKCSPEQAKLITFEAQEGETLDVVWVSYEKAITLDLFASHRLLLDLGMKKMEKQQVHKV